MWIDSLTGTIDVTRVLYVILSNGGISLNTYCTCSTSLQIAWHAYTYMICFSIGCCCCNVISAYRSFLTAAIDVVPHLGLTLNGDRTRAAHQC